MSAESVPATAEDPAAGQSRAEPEAEDRQRAVRAVCQGEACQKQLNAALSRPAHQLCVFTQRSREYPRLFLSEVQYVKNKSTLHSYRGHDKQNLKGDTCRGH